MFWLNTTADPTSTIEFIYQLCSHGVVADSKILGSPGQKLFLNRTAVGIVKFAKLNVGDAILGQHWSTESLLIGLRDTTENPD